jgi:radical SAM-linked protein
MDVVLHERLDARALFERLRATAPTGFLVLGVAEVPVNTAGLMGEVRAADYTLFAPLVKSEIEAAVARILAAETIPLEREGKKGTVTVDARAMLRHLSVRDDGAIDLGVRSIDGRPGKARDFVQLLDLPSTTRVLKRDVYLEVDGQLASPSAGWSTAEGEGIPAKSP